MGYPTVWNEENIRTGMERFKSENGQYPTARDFDLVDYLPSARQIQRSFGGLPALREKLKLEGILNQTKGKVRSEMAAKTFKRAFEYEERFYNFLISQIPEHYVHEQKRIRPGNISCDFFLYDPKDRSQSLVLDVFYAESLYNLAGVVNIKLRRYKNISYEVYFICVSEKITQGEIAALMSNKKIRLPNNIHVCSEEWFKAFVDRRFKLQ